MLQGSFLLIAKFSWNLKTIELPTAPFFNVRFLFPQMYDADNSGYISRDELAAMLKVTLHLS